MVFLKAAGRDSTLFVCLMCGVVTFRGLTSRLHVNAPVGCFFTNFDLRRLKVVRRDGLRSDDGRFGLSWV